MKIYLTNEFVDDIKKNAKNIEMTFTVDRGRLDMKLFWIDKENHFHSLKCDDYDEMHITISDD